MTNPYLPAIFCKDCRHFLPGNMYSEDQCCRVKIENIVIGIISSPRAAYAERGERKPWWFCTTKDRCGPEGKYFEERP